MNWDLNDVDLDLIADAMLHARPDLRFYFDPETGSVIEAKRDDPVEPRMVEIPLLDTTTLKEIALDFVGGVEHKPLATELREALESGEGLTEFERVLGETDPDLALDWFQELDDCALEAAESWLDSISS